MKVKSTERSRNLRLKEVSQGNTPKEHNNEGRGCVFGSGCIFDYGNVMCGGTACPRCVLRSDVLLDNYGLAIDNFILSDWLEIEGRDFNEGQKLVDHTKVELR